MNLVLIFLFVVAAAAAAGAVAMAASLFAVLEHGEYNQCGDSQQDKDDEDVSHNQYADWGYCCEVWGLRRTSMYRIAARMAQAMS